MRGVMLALFAAPAAAFCAPSVAQQHTPRLAKPRTPAPIAAVPVPSALVPVAGLAVLTSVVVVHEAGHFFAARLQGIRVSEFSIGFGPTIWRVPQRTENGPEYALRALPIGGFVSFPRATNRTKLEQMGLLKKGEKFDDEVLSTPDLLENRPLREQAVVVAAGVVANLVLAWACLTTSGVALGVPVVEPKAVVVNRVLPSSAAARAGFREGDLLLKVKADMVDTMSTGRPLDSSLSAIRGAVSSHQPFSTIVLRGDKRVTIRVPALPEEVTSLGVELTQPASAQLARVKLSPSESATSAVKAVTREAQAILNTLQGALGSIFQPAGPASGGPKLQGPVGIARMGNDLAATDALRLLEFGALLSLNLAVFNSLPLPGLDGWQMSLLALEALLRRPLPEAAKESANAIAGLLFLFAFSRVFVGDVQAAGGGSAFEALGAATGAVGAAVRELGPSVLVGVAVAQAVRSARNSRDGGGTSTKRSAKNDGSKQRWWRFDTWQSE